MPQLDGWKFSVRSVQTEERGPVCTVLEIQASCRNYIWISARYFFSFRFVHISIKPPKKIIFHTNGKVITYFSLNENLDLNLQISYKLKKK